MQHRFIALPKSVLLLERAELQPAEVSCDANSAEDFQCHDRFPTLFCQLSGCSLVVPAGGRTSTPHVVTCHRGDGSSPRET